MERSWQENSRDTCLATGHVDVTDLVHMLLKSIMGQAHDFISSQTLIRSTSVNGLGHLVPDAFWVFVANKPTVHLLSHVASKDFKKDHHVIKQQRALWDTSR